MGRHGKEGRRQDGRDLVAEARANGYTVVFTKDELAAVPAGTKKLLGIFASFHTFNDMPQPLLDARGLSHYSDIAPDLAEMLAKTLEIFHQDKFFIVAEEEGPDNFGNNNNALGVFESLKRADEALGVALDYVTKNSDTLLLTTGDSSAGNMDVLGLEPGDETEFALARNGRDRNGAPYETAPGGKPFLAAPDQFGVRLPFVISWGTHHDTSGGLIVRAAGAGAGAVRGSIDNTQIYSLMRGALFGGL